MSMAMRAMPSFRQSSASRIPSECKFVAEGVETQSQLQKLRDLSCDQVQGFLLGKPMGAEDFAAFVREQASESNLAPV